jgi:hypothetical protein
MSYAIRMPKHGELLVGQPSRPNRSLASSVARHLASFPEVREAHFPQCFSPDKMSEPAQVLVIVLDESQGTTGAFLRIQDSMRQVLARGTSLDILPIPSIGEPLESVRRAGSRILTRGRLGEAVVEDPWSVWSRALRYFRRAPSSLR